MPPILPIVVLLAAVLVFASGFVSGRLYIEAGGTPADVAVLRYATSALVVLPYVWIARRRLALNPGWRRAVQLSLVGGAPFGLLIMVGVAGAPISHGAAIAPGLAMVAGAAFAWVFLREPLGWRRCALLTAVSLCLFWLAQPALRSGEAAWWGEVAYVAAGFLWAGFTVTMRAFGLRPLDAASLAATFSLPLLGAFALSLDLNIAEIAWHQTLLHALWQGVLFNLVAVMMYGWGIAQLGAAKAAAFMALAPVYGVLLEYLVFAREPFWFEIAAVSLVVAGVIAFSRLGRTAPVRSSA